MKTLEQLLFSARVLLALCLSSFPVSAGSIWSWNSRFGPETLPQRIPSVYIHLKDRPAGSALNLRGCIPCWGSIDRINSGRPVPQGQQLGRGLDARWLDAFYAADFWLTWGRAVTQHLGFTLYKWERTTPTCPSSMWMDEVQIMEAAGI